MDQQSRSIADFPLGLKVDHVMESLNISRATAYKLVKQPGFPSLLVGKRIVIPKDKFLKWVDDQAEAI